MAKILIGIGIAFIVIGIMLHYGLFKYLPLGRLPGDIVIENKNSKIYFPIVSSIVVSILLSVLFYFLQKFK